MAIPEWFDWTSGAASLAGCGYAWWASRQATGAKRAAKEARNAVLQHNAADAFAEIVRISEQCATWVECERPAEAVVQLREIVLRLARDRAEFDHFLYADTDKLKSVLSRCQRLADLLTQEPFPFSVAAKREQSSETMLIVQELSAVLGSVRARIDLEEK